MAAGSGERNPKEANREMYSVDNETFINCIRIYRCIYDKDCKDDKVQLKKRNAWKEVHVSTKLELPVEKATKRLNNVHERNIFSKYVKRITSTRSGSGRNEVSELKKDMKHL